MCDKDVDDYLSAFKYFLDWFVTSKKIKKLLTASSADDNMFYFNEDSGNAVLLCNEMCILSICLNNINLDDTNYDEDDPYCIIHTRLSAWHIKFEKRKVLKTGSNKELMLLAWHPRRW